jgi:hypothetical protein
VQKYGLSAAFCGAFSAVYLHYSYGQSSPFLVFLFAPSLLLGLTPAALLLWTGSERIASRAVRRLWNSGVATLTVGFMVRAVINISGRYTDYDAIYWALGAAFLLAAFGTALHKKAQRRRMAAHSLSAKFSKITVNTKMKVQPNNPSKPAACTVVLTRFMQGSRQTAQSFKADAACKIPP